MSEDPLDWILKEHERQKQLCANLEKIADDLPSAVESDLVSEVLVYLRTELPAHIRDEEDYLFPLLARRVLPEDGFETIRSQLHSEHVTDECYALELSDALDEIAHGRKPTNPNTLGHMLRACFESHRRHLAWENAVVLPLARRRLTENDLETLATDMREARPVTN